MDLVNAHRDNIFMVDLTDNIAWVIVKMIDNKDCWGMGTGDPELGWTEEEDIPVAHSRKRGIKGGIWFTKKGKMGVGIDGWNEDGKNLYIS